MSRLPRIYAATEQAAGARPFPLLDGTVEAAQSYVDAIMTSPWWMDHCKPGWPSGGSEVPTKVLVIPTDLPGYGAGVLYNEKDDEKRYFDGRHVPVMMVGKEPSNGKVAPLADAWVLLHELAHVWEYESFHGKDFLYAFAALVKRFLGINHHAELVQAMRDHKIRLNYRSILNGSSNNRADSHPLLG